ncbi:MAG: hypothetical protein IJE00_00410 [Clostridia bacterium]|nr:hypothetical protein [Clostridia bacterium]
MPKQYTFEFKGAKQDFLNELDKHPHHTSANGNKHYIFHDCIIDIIDGSPRFGIQRGGHSGGYWYMPTITEYEDHIELCGTIEYIGYQGKQSLIEKVTDKIVEILLAILLFPLFVIFWLYVWISKWIRKLFRKPPVTEITTEDRLFDLMENCLGCTRKG